MSQEKVDRYKQEKANRDKLLKKQKRNKMLTKLGGLAVCLVIVGWVGFSAFNKFYTPPVKNYEVKTTAVDDYLQGLNETETESATEAAK